MRAWLKVRILWVYGRQRKFARAIGVSDFWLSQVVNGKKDPSDEMKMVIGEKLGVEDIEGLFVKEENISLKRNRE